MENEAGGLPSGAATETQILPPPTGDGRRGGETAGEPAEPARRSRRARIMAVGAIVLVAAAIALAIALRSPGKPHAAADIGVPAGDTTVSVQRRTLTEHAQVDGTLGYGSTLELFDRIPGTFTWLPSVGSVIQRGGTLFKIDQLPIVLMYGSVPAYRTLKEGVGDGRDVAQLNENLVALGYDPYGAITDYKRFGEATAEAVRRWQKAKGLPQTGEVELGRVIFAPSARRVTAVKATLGQDPPAGEGTQPAAEEREPAGEAPAQKTPAENEEAAKKEAPGKGTPAKETPAKQAPAKEAPAKEAPAKQAPAKEAPTKEAPTKEAAAKDPAKEGSPSKGTPSSGEPSSGEPSGGGGGAGTPVLTTTATRQIVQVQLEADKQQLARVGAGAPVTLPGGQTVNAHITSVGSVATESGGNGGEGGKAAIPVTLVLDRHVPHLDAAPVTVELLQARRRGVLSIPATALIATAAGGYAVEALQGGHRVEISVTPGMFADGYVQIEGQGVHEGLTVTEPAE